MSLKSRVAAALVVPAVALAALAANAGAGDVATYETELKIRDSFPAFHGRVKSDAQVCVANRTVKLFRKKPNGQKKLLGTDRSNGQGKWAVTERSAGFTLKSGAYFAKAPRKTRSDMGLPTICTKDKSEKVVVD